MNTNNLKKVYMIGIKGVGMTMLAQFLSENGIEITGSDTGEKYMTDEVLKKCGAKIIEKFDKNNIPSDTDLIIYSTAYNQKNNEEVMAALNGKIKAIIYAEALGEVFNQQFGIAVVGSHGKTTTSAWLGFVMEKSGLSPSVMVGARVPQFDGASLVGKSDYLVAELDEYQNKLKYFQPKAVLLNNIDYDHPDFFPTPEDYENVFIEFIKKIPKKGFLVANNDDPLIRKTASVNCRAKVITYAISESADYVAYDIKQERNPSTSSGLRQYFKVKLGVDEEGDILGDFVISLSGKHNIYNALAVIAASIELGINLSDIRKYLEDFAGTARRMQFLGEYNGAKIIDDYAHHPAEIKTTLAGVKQTYPNKKITVAFHPHTYTRTKALLGDFASSFDEVDKVIVIDIYGSAREEQGGVHSKDLINLIKQKNYSTKKLQEVLYISTLKELEEYLRKNTEHDEVIVLMGAGDIFRVGENLVK